MAGWAILVFGKIQSEHGCDVLSFEAKCDCMKTVIRVRNLGKTRTERINKNTPHTQLIRLSQKQAIGFQKFLVKDIATCLDDFKFSLPLKFRQVPTKRQSIAN